MEPEAQPPVPYAAPPVPARSGRPTSVLTIAAIGIFIGAMGLLCKPAGLIPLVVPMPQPNPMVDVRRDDPTIRAWTVASAFTGTLISLLLLLSSIGSIGLRRWARAGMLAYACLALPMSAIAMVVESRVVGPAIRQALQQSGTPVPGMMAWMSGWVGIAIGVALCLWLPVLILVVYLRRDVREAFERGVEPIPI